MQGCRLGKTAVAEGAPPPLSWQATILLILPGSHGTADWEGGVLEMSATFSSERQGQNMKCKRSVIRKYIRKQWGLDLWGLLPSLFSCFFFFLEVTTVRLSSKSHSYPPPLLPFPHSVHVWKADNKVPQELPLLRFTRYSLGLRILNILKERGHLAQIHFQVAIPSYSIPRMSLTIFHTRQYSLLNQVLL